ncbi:hypothetical protein KCU73_g3929, partial [Aureobasidium melanogenum]
MTGFAALPTEVRLMIFEALFDDVTEQYYPHPMLEVSERISTECKPYLFRHLELTIANPPPCAGLRHREHQWVAALSSPGRKLSSRKCKLPSRKRKRGAIYRIRFWEDFFQERSLSNWLPHLQQIRLYFFGFQGMEMWIANVKISFDAAKSSAPTIDFNFSNMHPALSAMYRKSIETAISTSNDCSVPLLRNLVNVLRTRETRSLTRKRFEVAPKLLEEIAKRGRR